MSELTLGRAMTYRAAFRAMRKKLEEAGVDVSGVRYMTDIPAAIANLLPQDAADAASVLLGDAGPEMIAELRAIFGEAAERGCLVDAIVRCAAGSGEATR